MGKRTCTWYDRRATATISTMAKQVAAVRGVLEPEWTELPVRPALCFIDSEWGWFAKPFVLDGVLVAWPKALRARLREPGPLSSEDVTVIAVRLNGRLRPAR